jgi:hypothetical protein
MAKQLTTFIANVPGTLAGLCRTLKAHNIDMRAMNVGDAMDFGIVRIIVDNTEEAIRVLEAQNFVCQVQDVLVIEVEDHPGALVGLLTTLEKAGVNVNYVYALFSRHEGMSGFVINTADREMAEKALLESGVRTIPEDEL